MGFVLGNCGLLALLSHKEFHHSWGALRPQFIDQLLEILSRPQRVEVWVLLEPADFLGTSLNG